MSSWPKIIRDPVHNIIPFGDNPCDRLLLALINTREFQRLRRIKQLGLSQLVFPGADHSRFAHSIGVMHLARRILNRIAEICPNLIDDYQRVVVLSAALLHDVGHGPFSHAFEKITEDKHEKRTLQIISSESTEVNQVLQSFAPELPERLQIFFDEDVEDSIAGQLLTPPFLTQIVSSQLDADRFDYLLRDSYSTGAEDGRFDLEWMLQHLDVDSQKRRFYLHRKALFAAETYVFARYHMYRTVYYHKTTRAAEVMLKLLFTRYKLLLADPSENHQPAQVVPNAPPAVLRAFSVELGLDEYLLLDDHTLTEFAKACTKCSDPVLAELANGLLYRRLFKAVDVTTSSVSGIADFQERAKEIIIESGRDAKYSFARDTPSDTAYQLYNPDAEKSSTQIYIEGGNGKQQELSQLSDSVKNQLSKKYTLVRYYFPAELQEKITSDAVPILFKE